jgi:hypothetical protein
MVHCGIAQVTINQRRIALTSVYEHMPNGSFVGFQNRYLLPETA